MDVNTRTLESCRSIGCKWPVFGIVYLGGDRLDRHALCIYCMHSFTVFTIARRAGFGTKHGRTAPR